MLVTVTVNYVSLFWLSILVWLKICLLTSYMGTDLSVVLTVEPRVPMTSPRWRARARCIVECKKATVRVTREWLLKLEIIRKNNLKKAYHATACKYNRHSSAEDWPCTRLTSLPQILIQALQKTSTIHFHGMHGIHRY